MPQADHPGQPAPVVVPGRGVGALLPVAAEPTPKGCRFPPPDVLPGTMMLSPRLVVALCLATSARSWPVDGYGWEATFQVLTSDAL